MGNCYKCKRKLSDYKTDPDTANVGICPKHRIIYDIESANESGDFELVPCPNCSTNHAFRDSDGDIHCLQCSFDEYSPNS